MTLDWYLIGTEMELDWQWIDPDGHQIDAGAGLNWHWIDLDWQMIGTGLAQD